MITLLAKAVEEAKKLSPAEQDDAAAALFVHMAGTPKYHLTPEQVREVQRIRRGLRSGKTKLVPTRTMKAFLKKLGV